MTTAIKSSLSNLHGVLEKLETSVSSAEAKIANASKAAQQAPKPSQGYDLFGAAASNDAEAKALASRLDGAIAKVEKLLSEGVSHG